MSNINVEIVRHSINVTMRRVPVSASGSGDMLKSVYDTDNNGVVDNSEQLNSQDAEVYLQEPIAIAISNFEIDLETGTGVAYFDIPYSFTLLDVYATVSVAPVGSNIIIDINEAGVSILGNKIVIEVNEVSSETASTQPTITDDQLAANARITFDIDQIGASTPGQEAIVYLIGYRNL